MQDRRKNTRWLINLLVALAVSLVVNFSYLLLLMVDSRTPHDEDEQEIYITAEGWLKIHPDGHGYLIAPTEVGVDSLYLQQRNIHWWKLSDGDKLKVEAEIEERKGANPRVVKILERNGKFFDEAELYHRPSQVTTLCVQLLFYFLLSFTIVTLYTYRAGRRDYSWCFYLQRTGIAILVIILFFLMAPVQRYRTGEMVLNFASGQMLDFFVVLRITFAVVVSMLYGYLYALLYKSQAIALENEHLKTENMVSRYNMLVGQVNPHFFFNSLNSLSMLVREGETSGALTYIDRLSYTFRYILQSGQATLVPLREELQFAEAYSFLFKTRYADKLFFDIEVEEDKKDCLLPALTLQPLMGNAVKHNTITRQNPLRVSIRTEGDFLVVENPIQPKLDPEPGMGIGLENLKNRWELISGAPIEIIHTEEHFVVRMPLQKKSL